MKLICYLALVTLSLNLGAQDKKEMQDLEKRYAAFTGHKQFFKQKKWAMCKFSVVYKLSTAMTAKDVEKKMTEGGEVKNVATSGAYALLNGLTEADLQAITNSVATNFIKRMKAEAGVEVITWSAFKDNPEAEKLRESAEETELFSVSQGLSYAMTYDGTPHYNRVIAFIPGGKKLAKDLGSTAMELTLVIDFAEVLAEAEAKIKYAGSSYNSVSYNLQDLVGQSVVAGVRILPNAGSQATMEAATNLCHSGIKGHDALGYMFSTNVLSDIISPLPIASSLDKTTELPEILRNRRNNKMQNVSTWNVTTNKAQFEAAVLDAVNRYLNDYIKIYNYYAAE